MRSSVGKKDRLVTIEQMTESQGSSGRPVETWTFLTKAWMERREINRRADSERFSEGALTARYDVSWVMHYQVDMDPELLNVPKIRRLSYGGRTYDITAAVPLGVHRDVELFTIAKG